MQIIYTALVSTHEGCTVSNFHVQYWFHDLINHSIEHNRLKKAKTYKKRSSSLFYKNEYAILSILPTISSRKIPNLSINSFHKSAVSTKTKVLLHKCLLRSTKIKNLNQRPTIPQTNQSRTPTPKKITYKARNPLLLYKLECNHFLPYTILSMKIQNLAIINI